MVTGDSAHFNSQFKVLHIKRFKILINFSLGVPFPFFFLKAAGVGSKGVTFKREYIDHSVDDGFMAAPVPLITAARVMCH